MNRKKLIGAIIGIIAFGFLIAGATYAVLTATLNVVNGTGSYNVNTMHFLIDYGKGNDITDVPILSSPSPSSARELTVTAGLASGSTPGKLTITLNTTVPPTASPNINQTLVTGGYIKYSYCVGTCSGTDFSDHTTSLTQTSSVDILSNYYLTSTTPTEFHIYFWVDDTMNLDGVLGARYVGSITATAEQVETVPTP